MKYVVTLNGNDYEVEVNELNEAVVTAVVPSAAPVAPVAAPVAAAPVAAPAVEAAPAPAAAPAPVAIGDGTKVAFNKLKDVLPNITVATASVVYQSAADVCVLAAEKVSVEDFKLTMAHDVLPNYLRLSQAERERNERMAKNDI